MTDDDPRATLLAAFDAVTRRIWKSAESESLDALQSFDLTLSQARALLALACEPVPMAISEVAGRINLSVATTGRVIDHLVKEEFVERQESIHDRRVKLVALTTRGRSLADAHIRAKRDGVKKILAQLSSEQCAALEAALQPLASDF